MNGECWVEAEKCTPPPASFEKASAPPVWLSSEWSVTDTGRRTRFYRLSRAGRTQLVMETESWQRLTAAVASVLEA